MFNPSGRWWIGTTRAPARVNASTAVCEAAPLAASTTTVSPSSRVPLDRIDQVLDVLLDLDPVVLDASDTPGDRALPGLAHPRLDGILDLITELDPPPRAKNLMPLSGIGLWLADSMTPPQVAPVAPTR